MCFNNNCYNYYFYFTETVSPSVTETDLELIAKLMRVLNTPRYLSLPGAGTTGVHTTPGFFLALFCSRTLTVPYGLEPKAPVG